MHVPDGFLDAPTSIATGAVAVVAVGVALRGARRELDDRTAPLAGLVAAFVFATQMLNFPVGAGTSGHLLGGALAAVLVGPFTGLLCMSVVFLVQALLFADGGITALGTNIDLMGLVTVVGRLRWSSGCCRRCCPSGSRMVAPAAGGRRPGVGAGRRARASSGSTPSAAPPTSRSAALATAMVGVHVLIGVGEAVITGLAVGSIVAVRPDLVYGARRVLATARRSRSATAAGRGRMSAASAPGPLVVGRPARRAAARRRGQLLRLHAAPTASTGSPRTRASPTPQDQHASDGSPLAGYGTKGVDDGRLSGGLAGVVGCVVVLALAGGDSSLAVRRRRTAPTTQTPTGARWAPGTATSCTSTATRRSTGRRRTSRCSALLGFMLVVVATPTELVRPPSPATCCVLVAVVALSPGAADVPPQADGRRGPVRACSRCCCRSSPPGPQVEVLGRRVSEHGLLARLGRCWPRARSACWPA